MRTIVLIAHNLRSCHNVGSLLRTAEGLGITKVYLTGYTPYPLLPDDKRLPHLSRKITGQIHKTALGAETQIAITQSEDIHTILADLTDEGFVVAALEQTPSSVALPDYQAPAKVAVLIGREVEGVEPEILNLTDIQLEIPMFGHKESFNVVQAAAMALFYLRFN
jgi:23S rRNA (guanosine2251-2'-O)-methyltransferase